MRTFHSDLSWNFLVSSPASTAYEFKSTVVFLVEDGPETSYGVIINRPLDKCISEFSDAVTDPDLGAVEVYEGGPVGITELIGIEVDDKPNALAEVIALIEAANINIEYLYSFVLTNHNSAKILMRVEDTDRALKILTEKGIKLLSEKIL